MVVVSVMYPGASGESFDHAYYTGTHIPLVRERWGSMGLRDVRLLRGTGTPDGAKPPYSMVALLEFESMEAFGSAAAQHGAELFGDIPNFTDAKPVVQFNTDAA